MASGFLDLAARATRVTPRDLVPGSAAMILSPHSEDETLGCGQLIAELCARGVQVQVVVITDDASQKCGPRPWSARRHATKRKAATKEAVRILSDGAAPSPWHLNLTLSDSAPAEAAARLLAISPVGCCALFSTWADDPHPDHGCTARIASELAAQRPDWAHWAYPIWGRFQDRAPDMPLLTLHNPSLMARKARAILAHVSPMSPPAQGFVMTKAQQTHFATHPEIFFRV